MDYGAESRVRAQPCLYLSRVPKAADQDPAASLEVLLCRVCFLVGRVPARLWPLPRRPAMPFGHRLLIGRGQTSEPMHTLLFASTAAQRIYAASLFLRAQKRCILSPALERLGQSRSEGPSSDVRALVPMWWRKRAGGGSSGPSQPCAA